MEIKDAITALAALAQDCRLAVFRMLVREGPCGLPAGRIAAQLGIPASTLSHHLTLLQRAGVLRSWRVERQIFYAVDVEGTRRLIGFLTDECCQGHPELCGYANGHGRGERCRDDQDLSQPKVWDVAQCTGDDPEFR